MSLLRVLVTATPSSTASVPWAVYDTAQRLVRSGEGPAATWPAAARREAVLAAPAVRIAHITLPPMPADRVPAAAAFALEDQLAGPAQAQHLVASPRGRDGGVDVAIAARDLFAPLRDGFARVVAEPAVAPIPPPNVWRWYVSGAGGGFVRRPDGSAFAVGAVAADGAVPAELALALSQLGRKGGGAPRVEVAFAADDARLRAFAAQCGTAFAATAPWRWDQDGAALAAASDLLHGEFAREPRAPAVGIASRFRWAIGLAAAALALHVGATAMTWVALRYDAWQTGRAIVSVAREAGAGDAPDADAAAAALAKRFTELRHRAAQPAPGDALPLLARAAPALAALPPGALKTAIYTAGTWTFDVGKLDPARAAMLERELTGAGLSPLSATTAAGTRIRVTPAAGALLP